jgi:hypothetical protein
MATVIGYIITKDLSPEQREKRLRIDKEFTGLPPQLQSQLLQHLDHLSSLPPDEQERMLKRMDPWENMTPVKATGTRTVPASSNSTRTPIVQQIVLPRLSCQVTIRR